MSNIIRIGTYNANNLFDRFDDPYNFSDDPWRSRFAAKPKTQEGLFHLGARIRASNVDILALQEIESYGALRDFNSGHVREYKLNSGVFSLPSNDPRGIDLGILTKLPFGQITTHRFRRQESSTAFSRDCLQVEILKEDRSDTLVTLFICHLKSKYSRYLPSDGAAYEKDQQKSNERRKQQVAETIAVVQENMDIDKDYFMVLGDLNDTPQSDPLKDFLRPGNPLGLTNALDSIPQDNLDPESFKKRPRDTHKWAKDTAREHNRTTYSQIDYLLMSKKLAEAFIGKAKVEQRGYTKGSDHYMIWAEFDADLM